MSISKLKLGLSCKSKAQQADRISCKEQEVGGARAAGEGGAFHKGSPKSQGTSVDFAEPWEAFQVSLQPSKPKMQGSPDVYGIGLPQGGASVLAE